MAQQIKKDNSTFSKKLSLRRSALKRVESPVIMETHGGNGRLFERCYASCLSGVVFEKDPKKASHLSEQRPTWAVYEGDCIGALESGIGTHLDINFLDIDPYGSPWDVVDAFFASPRNLPDTLHIVVNDGLRQKVQINSSTVKQLAPIVAKYGDKLYPNYLEVCQILMDEKASKAGYNLTRWYGYYCGSGSNMSHYWAVLEKG